MSEKIILLVDDNGNIVDSFKRSTHRSDFKVLTARSGFEALTVLKENHVDLLITDEMMPVMRGTELIAKVRELYPEVMVILFSGKLESTQFIDAVNGGTIFKILKKPISLEEILFHVTRALKLKDAFVTYQREHNRAYTTV